MLSGPLSSSLGCLQPQLWCWMASEVTEGRWRHFSQTSPSLSCIICRWLTMVPSFWPSLPHQGQKVTPAKWQRASGWGMPSRPMTLGNSKGGMGWKNCKPSGEVFSASFAYLKSSCPVQASWISKFWSLGVQQKQPSLRRDQLDHRRSHGWSKDSLP